MNTLRRWASTILSSFEAIAGQLENHEALVSSVIEDVAQSAARARAQLARVLRDGQVMRERLSALQEERDRWADRAAQTAKLDGNRAIECLKRKRRIAQTITDLEVHEISHTKQERQLAADLSAIEQRLQVLRQQRHVMRTRQSRSEALRLMQQVDSDAVLEIDRIFDRWNLQIEACEARAKYAEVDPLEEEFRSSEEEQHLQEELAALLAGEKK